jgi:Flp pilus assembly protein TadD
VVEFQAALEIQGDSAEAHQGLALAYAKLGRAELAEEHRQAFLRLRGGR